MTLSAPPDGGFTCIWGSTPAGGQMMPCDLASLSLGVSDRSPRPTVGPSTSGGQVGGPGVRPSPAACANAALVQTILAISAMIRCGTRNGGAHKFDGPTNFLSERVTTENVPL